MSSCREIFSEYITAHLLASLSVKKFHNQLRFHGVTAMSFVSSIFVLKTVYITFSTICVLKQILQKWNMGYLKTKTSDSLKYGINVKSYQPVELTENNNMDWEYEDASNDKTVRTLY